MRKTIVFKSVLTVFLLLLISHVTAIQYIHVDDKINEEIYLVDTRIERNEIQSDNMKEIKNTLDDIHNNPDGICLSCSGDVWNPRCLILFCRYISLVPIVFILETLVFFKRLLLTFMEMAQDIHNQAEELGCLWATN